jgi:polyisoprenyl-phosphate glycosyltransferase
MISVVIPVLNEQHVLRELVQRLTAVLRDTAVPYEVVFVNDGSTDESEKVLEELREQDARLKIIELSRNFGHQRAIMAGLDYATGDAVIMMDADLQHSPELIKTMIEEWTRGYEIVYTRREPSPKTGFWKRFTSRFFYILFNRLSAVRIPQGAADFRLLDKKIVEVLRRFPERTLFLRGLVQWLGYRQKAISYTADPRFAGETKYSFLRMLRLAVDGITSFSSIPLYFSMFFGLVISVISFIYGLVVIYVRLFTDRAAQGTSSILVAVTFMGGIILVTLGILGLYIGRIYEEVKNRPRYLVKKVHGLPEQER